MVNRLAAIVAGITAEPWHSPSEICKVCTERSEGFSISFLCSRCRRIYEQGGPAPEEGSPVPSHASSVEYGSECVPLSFTDLPLTERAGNRTSATWEHLTPGDQWSVVLAADLVNKMKGNMTEAQFRRMVVALADHFQTNEPFEREAFPVEASPFDATG